MVPKFSRKDVVNFNEETLYKEYKDYDKLYCMQHGQKLRSKRTKYKVLYKQKLLHQQYY